MSGKRLTEADKATMRALRKQGLVNSEIAKITGFTRTTVRKIVGLDPPKGIEKPCSSCGNPTRSVFGICQTTKKCRTALSLVKHHERRDNDTTRRYCANCGHLLRKDSKSPYCRRADSPDCRQKHETYRLEHGGRERSRQLAKDNPIRTLLGGIKHRAKNKNIPFDLTEENLPPMPEFCPALGTRLCHNDGRMGDNSPSLDRIIPELGYVVGNVQWLSQKANWMKNNATLCELARFGQWASEQAALASCA